MNRNVVFTICAKNYIGLACVLEQSLVSLNGSHDFFIIVADDWPDNLSKDDLPSSVLFAKDILNFSRQEWSDLAFKYDITEFCTSIKADCLSYFIDSLCYDKVVYVDPDICAYSSFDVIFDDLDACSIMLTPHVISIKDVYLGERSESGIMSTGVFNLGFIGVRSGVVSRKVLSWWKLRLMDGCFIDNYNSLYTDQKWMDFLPCLLSTSELYVIRNYGYNLAPWNFFERRIEEEAGVLYVRDRENSESAVRVPLVFMHFSGYDYRNLVNGIVKQRNIGLGVYTDMDVVLSSYIKLLSFNKEIFARYLALDYSFDRFSNGYRILAFHRRLYRGLISKGEEYLDPFAVSGNSFYKRLLRKGLVPRMVNFNLDRTTKYNIDGLSKKLKFISVVTRIMFKVIGFKNYLLFIKFLRPYGRYESQIHLFDTSFDERNIL
jgi:hypothetical protein